MGIIPSAVAWPVLYALSSYSPVDNHRRFISLQYFCQSYPVVDEHVREAMGENLYKTFVVSSRNHQIQGVILCLQKTALYT